MNKSLVISGITDPATLACLARSRKYSQYVKGVRDALAGACPFCTPDPKYNVIIEGLPSARSLRVWPCRPAEKNTRLHFLICPIRHVTSILQLSPDEWLEARSLIGDLAEIYKIPFRGILIRDGDATKSAGTIQHLHIHVMVPDGIGRVESPFCKTSEEEAAGMARAVVFEKMRTGTAFEDLLPEEREIVKDRLG